VKQPLTAGVVIELLAAPGPVPIALIAYTVNVYEVVGVSPVMLADVVALVVEPPDHVML
jgi:hypothetical protein